MLLSIKALRPKLRPDCEPNGSVIVLMPVWFGVDGSGVPVNTAPTVLLFAFVVTFVWPPSAYCRPVAVVIKPPKKPLWTELARLTPTPDGRLAASAGWLNP